MTNTSNSCITVQYFTGISRNPELNWGNAAVNQSNLKMILSPGESDEFVFYATQEFMEKQISQRVKIELILENRFSKRYKESFTVLITSLSNKVKTLPGNGIVICLRKIMKLDILKRMKMEIRFS